MTRQRARSADRGPIAKDRLTPDDAERLDLGRPMDLRVLVCAGFCTHYKPEAVEEWHCGGLGLVVRLREKAADRGGDEVAAFDRALRDAVASREPLDFAADALLERAVCATCAFLPEAGCDHRNPDLADDERLEPCGGYLLLTLLLRRGTVDATQIAAAGPSGGGQAGG
jgi:hypothetical protein